MSLKARVRKLEDRVNALNLRERALLLLACAAVLFLAWDLLFMQPLNDRRELVQNQLGEIRNRVSSLTDSIQQLAAERGRDPNLELEQRRGVLEDEISRLEQRLEQEHGGIATPRRSITLLAGLLSERSGVALVELENLPAEPFTGPDGEPVQGIHVHRVRLVIESDFEGIRDYLGMIRELPAGIFWDQVSLTTMQWPTNRLELLLYTLAVDDHWLGT